MGACVKDGHIHPLLEYISGGSLEDVLKDQEVSLSWQQKASLATDIARGMEYLHSKNVCHRDLKSENCLMRQLPGNKLEAVVADFGLARVLKIDENDPTPQQESPRRMSLVGSPYWMAPEILRGEEYTKTVDVFSFGIILCEIMARVPADPDDLPRTNLFGLDVDGFRKLCPGCPENMLQVAADCCSMDPTERPSFTEIYHRLCCIDHQMSTEKVTVTHISHVAMETSTQNGTIVNGDCCSTNGNKEPDRNDLEMETQANNVDSHEIISTKPTHHESTLCNQILAPGGMTNTCRVLRALYITSAIGVLATLLAVLNFWQSIYTLLSVLVPLTVFTLYPVSIPHW
ncbi:dual specificity testis-specific protein kinase 1-like [Amphiura filiformis]